MKKGTVLAMVLALGVGICAFSPAVNTVMAQAQVKPVDNSGVVPVQASRSGQGSDQIQVELKGDAISVNGTPTTLDGFSQAMRDAAGAKGKSAQVQFRCAPGVTMTQVFDVQMQMMDLGMKRVVFAGGKSSGVPLVLPTAAAKSRLAALPADQVLNLEMLRDRQVIVNGQTMPLGKARTVISGKLAARSDAVVSLTPYGQGTYKEMMVVLDQLKNAGAKRIALQEPK